jgi:hypothetical protein
VSVTGPSANRIRIRPASLPRGYAATWHLVFWRERRACGMTVVFKAVPR